MKKLLFLIAFVFVSSLEAQTNGLNGGSVSPLQTIVQITNHDGTVNVQNGSGPIVIISSIGGGGVTNGGSLTNLTIPMTNYTGTSGTTGIYGVTNALGYLWISNYFNTSLTNGLAAWSAITNGASEGYVWQYHAGALQWINTNLFGGSGGGGGWSNTVSAIAPITATTNNIGAKTNTAIGLSVNPLQFSISSGQLNLIQTSSANDTRQISDYDLKGVGVLGQTMVSIFTNVGPCTVTSLRVDYAVSNSSAFLFGNWTNGPTLSIWADGVSNGCQLLEFLAAQGGPTMAWHGDSIDLNSVGFQGSGIGGQRGTLYINAFTSCGAALSWPTTNGAEIWTDVNYRSGTPVVTNSWHMAEAKGLTANSAVFSVGSVSGKVGQVESVVQFTLASGVGQVYLESKPALYLDNQPPLIANGNEDFFGGSWYFNLGAQVYHTPIWGNESEGYLQAKFGYSDANCSYRFFQGAFFTNSFSLNFTNLSGTTISNDWLASWWTYP